jgi:hypothetical protein
MRRARPISSALPRRLLSILMTSLATAAAVLLLGLPNAGAQEPLRIITPPVLSPTIALVGQTITPTPGTWDGPIGATARYEWRRCDENGNACELLGTGTAQPQPHIVTAADIGHTLRIRLTIAVGSNTQSGDSNPALVPRAPSNTAAPGVNGTVRAGEVLTASPGAWSGTPPLSFEYQWLRCGPSGAACLLVPDATKATYLLSGADVGLTFRVRVTASNPAGSAAAASPQTGVVAPLPLVNVELPAIVGTAEVDRSLTALPGRWNPSDGIEFVYRWLRCRAGAPDCDAIPGATGRTYDVRVADVGSRLRVRVTALADGGSATATSAMTVVVPAPRAQDFTQTGTTPGTSPGPATEAPTLMRPLPRVRTKGFYTAAGARLQLVTIKGPAGVRIRLVCRGESCPFRRRTLQGRPRVRLRSLERFHPAGTRIVIRVTSAGVIGKYTRIIIRGGRPPTRRDRCLLPDATRPVRCPLQGE